MSGRTLQAISRTRASPQRSPSTRTPEATGGWNLRCARQWEPRQRAAWTRCSGVAHSPGSPATNSRDGTLSFGSATACPPSGTNSPQRPSSGSDSPRARAATAWAGGSGSAEAPRAGCRCAPRLGQVRESGPCARSCCSIRCTARCALASGGAGSWRCSDTLPIARDMGQREHTALRALHPPHHRNRFGGRARAAPPVPNRPLDAGDCDQLQQLGRRVQEALVPSRRFEGLERVQGDSRLVFMRCRLRWRLNKPESDQKHSGRDQSRVDTGCASSCRRGPGAACIEGRHGSCMTPRLEPRLNIIEPVLQILLLRAGARFFNASRYAPCGPGHGCGGASETHPEARSCSRV